MACCTEEMLVWLLTHAIHMLGNQVVLHSVLACTISAYTVAVNKAQMQSTEATEGVPTPVNDDCQCQW